MLSSTSSLHERMEHTSYQMNLRSFGNETNSSTSQTRIPAFKSFMTEIYGAYQPRTSRNYLVLLSVLAVL